MVERPVSSQIRTWRSTPRALLTSLVLACLAALFLTALPARAAAQEFRGPTKLAFTGPSELESDAGHAMLSWQSDEPVSLEIAEQPDFANVTSVYSGPAHSYFLSGLANGDYYLRVQGESGAMSAPLHISVVHQSLSRALMLVALGALVTLAIVVTVLRGARDE